MHLEAVQDIAREVKIAAGASQLMVWPTGSARLIHMSITVTDAHIDGRPYQAPQESEKCQVAP